jgi:hypothetical protein
MQSDLEYFIAFVSKFRNILFRYPLLKLIVSSSEKSTLIIAFELLIIEFMERSTSSKIVFKFNSSIWELVAFFYLKQLCIHLVAFSVEDFRSEINSSVSESVILERSKVQKTASILLTGDLIS